jgi:hypothetical protein
MPGADRSIWLRVANGVESLSGQGPRVWNEPPAVANALRELLSVLPLTHAQIDLAALRGRSEPRAQWKAMLAREGDWNELLRELVAAVGDAVRGRAAWGLGLPGPDAVADELGDPSERGVLKAGLQLAGFLQGFREAGVGFVSVDLTGASVSEKAVAPIFRNAQMYEWKRAAIVRDDSSSAAGAEIRLVDGLTEGFWTAEEPAPQAPTLFGEIPSDIEPAAIVAAGRKLERWKE